ncbi:MAG: hypothetical protein P4L42_10265 [Desulfocapsaceae bacterium]|nr:hypothetical protein [Desulfocapsaceae bacterium]
MGIPLKPLGIIKEMLDGIGFEVTYAYDDLIFIAHNAFLLQMGSTGEEVGLYFHTDSSPDKRDDITNLLKECGRQYRFAVDRKGTYTVSQNTSGEDFQLCFFDGHS